MINVAEAKMIMRMLEKQILDIQASCEHKSYVGQYGENRIKCTCDKCQHVWYIEQTDVQND